MLCLLAICSLSARDVTVPSGANGQLQFTLSMPEAFGSLVLTADLDPAIFAEVVSVSGVSAMGDATGYVTVDKLHVEVHLWSRLKGLGRVAGQPVVIVNARTLPGVAAGRRAVLNAQMFASDSTIGTSADRVAFDADAVTIGGTLSVSDARLESASAVRVRGTGFGSGTTLTIEGAVVSDVSVLSEQELVVTLGGSTEIVGKRVSIRKANGETADFYPTVFAGAPDTSNRLPIFPQQPQQYAIADYIRLRYGTVFLGNTTSDTVDVEVVATDTSRSVLRTTAFTLRPGESWSGLTTDLGAYASSSYLYVYASAPVLMLQLMHVDSAFSIPPATYDYAAPFMQTQAPRLGFSNPPDNVSWVWQTGTALPVAKTIKLTGAAGSSTFNFQLDKSGGDWFTASTSSNSVCSSYTNCSPSEITVRANPNGLAPGIYRGTVTLTPTANRIRTDVSPVVIPVALTITASPFTKTAVGYAIFTQPGGSLTQTQAILPDIIPGALTVSVLAGTDRNWLTATPAAGTSPATVTLTANPAGLGPGTYSGHVVIQGSGNAQIIETLLFVYSGVRLRAADTYLQFGGSDTQVIAVTPDCQLSGCPATLPTFLPFTASANTNSGGNWLSVTAASDRISVSTNAEGLKPGNYTGSVTVRSPSLPGSLEIPVVLIISDGHAPALLTSPTSVDLVAGRGDAGSQQYLCVSSDSTPTTFEVHALTKGSGNWLRIELSQAVTNSCGLTLSADASQLDVGVYTGEVIITAAGQSVSVPVTLRVTQRWQPFPFIGTVVNAASLRAGSITGGEIVTIFGSALGNNVLVDGIPAQVLYASDQQVNAVVPETVRGSASTKVEVGSASWILPVSSAVPGVFGVLNQNDTLNSMSNPAGTGSILQVFGTGFDAGAVTVSIAGKRADVLFAGQAPGAVTGLFQVNVMLPAEAGFGDAVPLVIQVSGVGTEVPVALAH